MDAAEVVAIVERVADEHRAHTALLYGSWARGDATRESDIDVLLVVDEGASVRDARVVSGVHLDAFVYPASALATVEPGLLRILGARVVRERDAFGQRLLAAVAALESGGPTPLPRDQRDAIVLWSRRALDRSAEGRGTEGDYRRHMLLVEALEDYFTLRGSWFRGSKEALVWLRENDPPASRAFEAALSRAASDADVATLVGLVYGVPAPA